ncbi:hypothetical protein OE88DRAFT_1722245 [Heliocybe sulcata]|uniref:Uncharacterized protein n=1 Tax=Heliocybe sulcata TaxID=5364 RepID=A0A5C3NIW4_9AGAM|nr:hypothetical protein OE88DRAFT_1722245 [Heliocybe sulcata]
MDTTADNGQLNEQLLRLLGEDLLRVKKELSDTQAALAFERRSSTAGGIHKESLHLREELEAANSERDALKIRVQELSGAHRYEDASPLHDPAGISDLGNLRMEVAALSAKMEEKNAAEEHYDSPAEFFPFRMKKITSLKEKVAALRTKSKDRKATCKELQMRLDEALADRSASQVVTEKEDRFPEDFLVGQTHSTTVSLPDRLEPLRSGPYFHLRQGKAQSWSHVRFMECSPQDTCWGDNGKALGVTFVPMHRYNPEKGVQGWEHCGLSSYEKGGQYELIYLENGQWCYFGTYEALEIRSIPFEKVKELGPDIQKCLIVRTITNRDFAPPILSAMLQSMYASGALRVECMAIRRIGFNSNLYNDLLGRPSRKGVTEKLPAYIPTPGQKASRGKKREFEKVEGHPSVSAQERRQRTKGAIAGGHGGRE